MEEEQVMAQAIAIRIVHGWVGKTERLQRSQEMACLSEMPNKDSLNEVM